MTSTEQTQKSTSRTGVVAKVGGEKTVSVVIESTVKHQRYGKYMRRLTKLMVHDPSSLGAVGDLVEIVPCRPVSKNKSWRLVRVVRTSSAAT